MKTPIMFDLGEPRWSPPESVVMEAARAAMDYSNHYAPAGGIPELKEAIRAYHDRHYGCRFEDDRIAVTSGASVALFAALRVIQNMDAQAEVLLPDPGYPAYVHLCDLLGLRKKFYRLLEVNGYQPDLNEIASQITEHTKAILINSPSNPLGTVFSDQVLRELAELVARNGLYTISDEVYEALVFQGRHAPVERFDPEMTISIYSFSKSFALCGWRVGYVLSSPRLVREIQRVQWNVAMNPCTIGQHVAAHCMENAGEYRDDILNKLERSFQVVRSHFKADIVCHYPDAGYYLWLDIRDSNMDDIAFREALWEAERMSVMPGSYFGEQGRGHIRMICSTELDELLDAISRFKHFYLRTRSNARSEKGGGNR